MANIDTLQAYEKLIATGVPEGQAKAHVKTLNDSLNGLATKEDLKNGFNLLESKIEAVKSNIGLMQKWEVGLLLAILGMVAKAAFWG